MLNFNFIFENTEVSECELSEIKSQLIKIHELPVTKFQKDFKYFIVKKNSTLAGVIVIDEDPKIDWYGLNNNQLGTDIEIVFFYVYPQFRGQRIGFDLLSHVIQLYPDKYIGLGTSVLTSENAKRMYMNNGFEKISDIHKDGNSWWLRKPTKHYSIK